ncbi:MAG: hypothetical protein ACXVFN_23340 [Solirubrobacteraceae bacterium]
MTEYLGSDAHDDRCSRPRDHPGVSSGRARLPLTAETVRALVDDLRDRAGL